MGSDKFRRDLQKRAAAKAKQTQSVAPVKAPAKKIPVWQGCLIVALVGLVVGGILLVLVYKVQVEPIMQDMSATAVLIKYDVSASVYCESVLEKPDNDPGCAAWSKAMIDTQLDRLKTCEAAYDWITETDEYTACLILGGVSVFSRTKLTGSTEFDTSDYEAMAPLSLLCKQSRSDDYCVAWSWYVYTAFRSQVKPCVQYRLNMGDYAGCIAGEGIATP